MELLVFVLFAALAAGIAYLSWKADQARRLALQELAGELGLDFDAGPDSSHDERYAQFEIFRRGHSRVARNTLHGTMQFGGRDCTVCLGDFRYKITRKNGKSSSTSTYDFSYLIVHPPWHTPALLVRPEGLFDKVASAFGFDDIDFESEEFSRAFWVESSDKRFAYDVLHPRMMEFLLRERPPMLDLEQGALCISDGSRRWDLEDFAPRLLFVKRFCELWPRHLLVDLEKS